MPLRTTIANQGFSFATLRELLAKASPRRSGDELAGVAAADARERVAAQLLLADTPLARFLDEPVVPYESDDVTRLDRRFARRGAVRPGRRLDGGAIPRLAARL